VRSHSRRDLAALLSRAQRLRVRIRPVAVGEELRREALPLRDAFGLDGDRMHFRWSREFPGAVAEPHARQYQYASKGDGDYRDDERCIRIHDRLLAGVNSSVPYVLQPIQVSCPNARATRAVTRYPARVRWNTT